MEQRRTRFITVFSATHFAVAFVLVLFGLFSDGACTGLAVAINVPMVIPVIGILAVFAHYELMFPGLLCVLPFAIFGAMAVNSRLWAHLAWWVVLRAQPFLGGRQRVRF